MANFIVDPARYLFVRLFARKNGWFRVARLGYHDELVDVQAAVNEICNTIGPGEEKPVSAVEDPHTQICVAGPSGTSAQAQQETYSLLDESIVITIDSDEEEACIIKKERAKDVSSKLDKSVDKGKGRVAVDPMSNRPLKEVKKEQKDFGLTRFAINEQILAERNDVDELLSLLSLDELKVSRSKLAHSALVANISATHSNRS
jgi:Fanconi-associated nuclease 1